MDGNEVRRKLAEQRTQRERLFGELTNLRALGEAEGPSDGLAERTANLHRGIADADDRIAEFEGELGRQYEREQLARDPRHLEAGHDLPARRERDEGGESRDRALRTIERFAGEMDDGAADRLDGLVRRDAHRDWTSRYLAIVGSDEYKSAFGKLCVDPNHAHLRMTAQESEAVRAASAIEAERALNIGTGSAGGFLLPFQLDPSVMLSSNGALNPIRQVARTVVTSANEWRGVSSDGVTASFSAEGAAMVDGSPVFAQPTITCRRWTAFVPYSWELGQDWSGLESELVGLIADGRDVLESSVFYSGTSSSNQPQGILTGLGTSQQVITVSTAVYAAGDVWALREAIPPRFSGGAAWVQHPNLLDKTYRLVPNASTSEPQLMETRDGAVVGKPAYEWSSLGGTVGTGATIALAGNFNSGYVIADRLGLTAIPIQVLFSGNTAGAFGYPTGQSGLAVWGRTGASVVNANAIRVLTVR
jgi:HK97 family phage major capsid protein